VYVCHRMRLAHESRQVPNPYTKRVCANALRVINGVIKDAEGISDEKFATGNVIPTDRRNEINRIRKILIKREASILDCDYPRIGMIDPSRIRISEGPEEQESDECNITRTC
jgi:hypothetical protein